MGMSNHELSIVPVIVVDRISTLWFCKFYLKELYVHNVTELRLQSIR